ncbi:MAG TPA: alcohol dehydrogenase catalytic domain-containing protein [Phycisphaerales bacterium]|nr:alcohol dehydrogenase catalytic domain-containing protein [Phycisphaerales bacterium]
MRAIIFDGENLRLESNHPAPRPAAGEAVVRLRRAIVSPFDGQAARGATGFKGVLGHQFVGIVETVHGDAAASRRLVNQRVVGSIVSSCGECDLCRKGLPMHCRQRTIMGVCDRDGCFAERFCIAAKQLVTVPNSVDDDRAAFAFEVASALHASHQLTIANRPYITILGDSALALIAGQVMSKLNATVRIVGTDAGRLELCAKWSVKHRLLSDVGMRNDQDIVIDCTGDGLGLTSALSLVRPRGKIVLKSHCTSPAALASSPLDAIVRHEIEVIGSFAGSMSEAVGALAANSIDVVSLISKRVPLRDGVAAIKALGNGGPSTLLTSEE